MVSKRFKEHLSSYHTAAFIQTNWPYIDQRVKLNIIYEDSNIIIIITGSLNNILAGTKNTHNVNSDETEGQKWEWVSSQQKVKNENDFLIAECDLLYFDDE